MPPRYAYWTIIVDNQPTAFRSAAVEEIMPTFNRLKARHAGAALKWFENGKLWDSQLDARDAIRQRRDEKRQKTRASSGPSSGRRLDWTPKGSDRDKRAPADRKPRPHAQARPKLDWRPRPPDQTSPKLEWKPRDADATKPPQVRSTDRRQSPTQRDSKWRPGGEHRDPRQKYKDAKKAKWTRFKNAIRSRRSPRKP